jgi:hypothetical protein
MAALATRFAHRFGSVVIDSAVELPGLASLSGALPTRHVAIHTRNVDTVAPASSTALWNPIRTGWRYCTASAQFDITDGGWRITVGHLHDVNEAELERLLVDHVLPRALVVSGHTMLHATAIELDGCGVAFVGASGAGKSTMAMSFVGAGSRLLADDALMIERHEHRAHIIATQHIGRLWTDSAEALGLHDVGVDDRSKCWAETTRGAERTPLTAVILLQRNDTNIVSMQRVGPSQAAWTLARQTFGGQMNGRPTAELLNPLAWIAEQVPVFTLSYPSHFEGLDRTRQDIVSSLAPYLTPNDDRR